VTETKIVFTSGAEVRIHEELDSVLHKILMEETYWVQLERGGTKPNPICINSENVAYLEGVEELEPGLNS
jgi:hypothetical protein